MKIARVLIYETPDWDESWLMRTLQESSVQDELKITDEKLIRQVFVEKIDTDEARLHLNFNQYKVMPMNTILPEELRKENA